MSAIRGSNNRTEEALRKAMFRRGRRYRKYVRGLPGKPDFAFPGQRLAVFVDGDFWHGRILRERGPEALLERFKTENRDYWIRKITRNVERDTRVNHELEKRGWTVLRFWETEIKDSIEATADRVERTLEGLRQEGK